jgi:hypothetical protein
VLLEEPELEGLRRELGLAGARVVDAADNVELVAVAGGRVLASDTWTQMSVRAASSWLAGARLRDPRYGTLMGAELLPRLCKAPAIMLVLWRAGRPHLVTPRAVDGLYGTVSAYLRRAGLFDVEAAAAGVRAAAMRLRAGQDGAAVGRLWDALDTAVEPVHVRLDAVPIGTSLWVGDAAWLPAEWRAPGGGRGSCCGPAGAGPLHG